MLLAEPGRTQFDLNFQVLGFPVRVHPFFWLSGLLLGFDLIKQGGAAVVIWFFALFVSILIHELGHALMIRRLGRDAFIVLTGFGGLAIEGRPKSHGDFGSPWSFESSGGGVSRARTPQEQIIISAAGPGIQFAFAAVLIALLYAMGGHAEVDRDPFPFLVPVLGGSLAGNENLFLLFWFLLQINIFWAIMNLLPVLPLDGGQIALQVLTQQDPWGGMRRALWLSVITGAVVAVIALVVLQETYMMMLFALLAVSSYLALQQAGGQRPW